MFLVGGGGEGRGRRFVWGGWVGREKGGLVVDGVEVNEGAEKKSAAYVLLDSPSPAPPSEAFSVSSIFTTCTHVQSVCVCVCV